MKSHYRYGKQLPSWSTLGLTIEALSSVLAIAAAEGRAGRPGDSPAGGFQIAVGRRKVRAALDAGVTLIGENYVKERRRKRNIRLGNDKVEWHMIGHLQRNKTKLAVELFEVVESLDNLALAQELNKEAGRRGKAIAGLLFKVN